MNVLIPDNPLDKATSKPRADNHVRGRLGELVTRLAESNEEVQKAQRIRYQVFCEEFSALKSSPSQSQLEQEKHDLYCDHLLVLKETPSMPDEIIGTQRFLLKQSGKQAVAFRSQSEFDFQTLADKNPEKRFMELGRSCILKQYRNKRTMELMWHGTWAYAVQNQVDVMLGCASFYAKSQDEIALELGFLSNFRATSPNWQVTPTAPGAKALEDFAKPEIDAKGAIRNLPPLLKGYLRLGAFFSDHAVIDEEFGTIDVAVILPVENINPRYIKYYGADASKHSGDKPASS